MLDYIAGEGIRIKKHMSRSKKRRDILREIQSDEHIMNPTPRENYLYMMEHRDQTAHYLFRRVGGGGAMRAPAECFDRVYALTGHAPQHIAPFYDICTNDTQLRAGVNALIREMKRTNVWVLATDLEYAPMATQLVKFIRLNNEAWGKTRLTNTQQAAHFESNCNTEVVMWQFETLSGNAKLCMDPRRFTQAVKRRQTKDFELINVFRFPSDLQELFYPPQDKTRPQTTLVFSGWSSDLDSLARMYNYHEYTNTHPFLETYHSGYDADQFKWLDLAQYAARKGVGFERSKAGGKLHTFDEFTKGGQVGLGFMAGELSGGVLGKDSITDAMKVFFYNNPTFRPYEGSPAAPPEMWNLFAFAFYDTSISLRRLTDGHEQNKSSPIQWMWEMYFYAMKDVRLISFSALVLSMDYGPRRYNDRPLPEDRVGLNPPPFHDVAMQVQAWMRKRDAEFMDGGKERLMQGWDSQILALAMPDAEVRAYIKNAMRSYHQRTKDTPFPALPSVDGSQHLQPMGYGLGQGYQALGVINHRVWLYWVGSGGNEEQYAPCLAVIAKHNFVHQLKYLVSAEWTKTFRNRMMNVFSSIVLSRQKDEQLEEVVHKALEELCYQRMNNINDAIRMQAPQLAKLAPLYRIYSQQATVYKAVAVIGEEVQAERARSSMLALQVDTLREEMITVNLTQAVLVRFLCQVDNGSLAKDLYHDLLTMRTQRCRELQAQSMNPPYVNVPVEETVSEANAVAPTVFSRQFELMKLEEQSANNEVSPQAQVFELPENGIPDYLASVVSAPIPKVVQWGTHFDATHKYMAVETSSEQLEQQRAEEEAVSTLLRHHVEKWQRLAKLGQSDKMLEHWLKQQLKKAEGRLDLHRKGRGLYPSQGAPGVDMAPVGESTREADGSGQASAASSPDQRVGGGPGPKAVSNMGDETATQYLMGLWKEEKEVREQQHRERKAQKERDACRAQTGAARFANDLDEGDIQYLERCRLEEKKKVHRAQLEIERLGADIKLEVGATAASFPRPIKREEGQEPEEAGLFVTRQHEGVVRWRRAAKAGETREREYEEELRVARKEQAELEAEMVKLKEMNIYLTRHQQKRTARDQLARDRTAKQKRKKEIVVVRQSELQTQADIEAEEATMLNIPGDDELEGQEAMEQDQGLQEGEEEEERETPNTLFE